MTDEIAFVQETLRAEADAVLRIADLAGGARQRDWSAAIDLLAACRGHVVVCGMGKSGLVGTKISATLASLGQPSHVVHPAEAVHGDLGRIRRGDVVMLLSYSGETDEVVNLAAILEADDVPRLGVSVSDQTSLARLSTVHLAMGDVTEACPLRLAPTASTTAMLALGDALALAVSRRRNFTEDEFRRHHPGGLLGAGLRKVTEALRFRVGENLTVAPQTLTVRDACTVAGDGRRAGAILLVDGDGRLSGIFTDGDLRRLVLRDDAGADGASGLDRPIAEVMTRQPRVLNASDLVRDAVLMVRERRVDEIPVVDDEGKPVGLIDVQDLIAMKVVQE